MINADSLQFYQGLDIGTGKIKTYEMKGVPHHLIDFLSANDSFDVHQFVNLADQVIQEIYQAGKVPIIVGGTGLYIEALLYKLELSQGNSSDSNIKSQLMSQIESQGNLNMWQQLQELDPLAAQQIPYQNSRRIIRALEYISVTGQRFSDQTGHDQQISKYKECLFILDRPRQELYQRINSRVLAMVEEGLEEEVHQLYLESQGHEWQSLKAIGYKEWFPYFKGNMNRQDVIETIQQNSRRYAKRQLTWYRNRFKSKHWIQIEDNDKAFNEILGIIYKKLGEGSEI